MQNLQEQRIFYAINLIENTAFSTAGQGAAGGLRLPVTQAGGHVFFAMRAQGGVQGFQAGLGLVALRQALLQPLLLLDSVGGAQAGQLRGQLCVMRRGGRIHALPS